MGSKFAFGRRADGRCERIEITDVEGGSAISISASVGDTGFNIPADVRTIQDALNNLDVADGGPTEPLTADGIIGPRTIAAIRRFQTQNTGVVDGHIDPNGGALRKLNELLGNTGNPSSGRSPLAQSNPNATKKSATPATLPHNPFVIPDVFSLMNEARAWVFAARRDLGLARDFIEGRAQFPTLRALAGRKFELVNKYFHVNALPKGNQSNAINRIDGIYVNMQTAIGRDSPMTQVGTGFFQEDPTADNRLNGPHQAFTFPGGFFRTNPDGSGPRMSAQDNFEGPNLREDTIFLATDVLGDKTNESLVITMVHELAHFVGPDFNSANTIDDHNDILKVDFLKLGEFFATRTAECYAFFAGEAKLGRQPVG